MFISRNLQPFKSINSYVENLGEGHDNLIFHGFLHLSSPFESPRLNRPDLIAISKFLVNQLSVYSLVSITK